MAFKICFTSDPDQFLDDNPTIPSAVGRIVIGEFEEEFVSSLYEWNREAYLSQWLHSLESFLDGDERAVLVTWYVNPKESANLQWWALYRGDNDTVHIQNHLPWYSNFGREFAIAEASSSLGNRKTINEDGNTLSEWNVPLLDIQNFVELLKRQAAGYR